MNEKHKAKELIEKYLDVLNCHEHDNNEGFISASDIELLAKQCAIICVDEILKVDPLSPSPMTGKTTTVETYKGWEKKAYDYWKRVKTEIENY